MAGGEAQSWTIMHRRRVFDPEQLETSDLKRCLTKWDLTALGTGSTLGVGVYVLVGAVALRLAGPSIVLSFLLAAVASLFAGLCYAEFGSRVPRAGSAYIYTYVAVNKLIAFMVGWNNILELVFGTASVARGLSMYVDSMTNNTMADWFTTAMPINQMYFSPYFDLFSFFAVIILGVWLSFGVRQSAMVNNVLCAVNLLVILFIVFAGAASANTDNWYLPDSDVPLGHGVGGFFPYGVWGTLKGAAVCFYGFVGFSSVSYAGEEAFKPRRSIPQTILIVLVVAFVGYASVSIIITMMVPYYLQEPMASVATAFSAVGWDWAYWIVSVGAVFGITSSLYGAMFPLPRLLYSMSLEGMSLPCFAKVSTSQKSPVIATLVSTAVIAILSGILELDQLILMVCFGTLLSYTMVAASVILMRYRSDYMPNEPASYLKQVFGCGDKLPTQISTRIIEVSLVLFTCVCVSMALVAVYAQSPVIPTAILHAAALILLIVMTLQPKAKEEIIFKTPVVPIVPCLSIYVNTHLMILINVETWIRVAIWILIGIPVYFICVCCCSARSNNLEQNLKTFSQVNNKKGKPAVQIIVESPTPPDTMARSSIYGGNSNNENQTRIEMQEKVKIEIPIIEEEILIQHAVIENNEEKEAKIIDLLDQVLQAEEENYSEIHSLKDPKEQDESNHKEVHRKSLSELSDAGSDASLGNSGLSKYDVVAQVHREDLPKVNEEEETLNDRDIIEDIDEHEQVTAFNDSETNSRTDESGYSDTLDRNILGESIDDGKDETSNIPVPPPLDENFFASPNFKKSYTISARPTPKPKDDDEEEISKPRESVQSNGSQSEDHIVFGSDRQINFMSKLNNIFQNKMSSEDDEQRKRSRSVGNCDQNSELSLIRERPPIFLDLKKEIMSKEASQNLRPVNSDENKSVESEEEPEDLSLSRDDLKTKLENIFASGGPKLLKPRLMKSNPPTPEEAYQTDTSSTESIPKLPKMEKNDTLKRQKDKFGEVLNSFRLSLNKDDVV